MDHEREQSLVEVCCESGHGGGGGGENDLPEQEQLQPENFLMLMLCGPAYQCLL